MKLVTFISAGIFIVVAGLLMKKQESSQLSLYETKWMLRKVQTEKGLEVVNTKAFLKFDKEKGSAGGNGSCNSFGSNALVEGSTIKFSNIFSTKMYCEAVQQTENAFFNQLGNADRFSLKGKTLSFYKGDTLVLEFAAEDNKQ
jgi:heat shock protein HslJ